MLNNIETVLATREETHGVYREQAAFAQQFKRMMRAGRNWERLDFYQAQSMEAFADKLSRILCGNFNEPDHWRDVSGYATLVLNEMHAGGQAHIKPQPGDEPLNAPEFLMRKMENDLSGGGQ